MSSPKITEFKPLPGLENREKKKFTLAFIQKEDEILLGLKKRGLGHGLWNGFGGKINPGENILEAAAREIQEECGLEVIPEDLEQFAVILFEFIDEPIVFEMHVFKTQIFTGKVTESDEMLPKWFPRNNVPHDQMWPDDEVWYPLYMAGKKFTAKFLFEGYSKILSFQIYDSDTGDLLKSKD